MWKCWLPPLKSQGLLHVLYDTSCGSGYYNDHSIIKINKEGQLIILFTIILSYLAVYSVLLVIMLL